MALYKRKAGGPWHVKFSSGGEIIRRSSGSRDRKFAEEYETTLRARYLRHEKLGECVHFWSEAVKRYKKEATWRETTRATNEYALSFFTAIDNLPMGDLDIRTVASARAFVERTQTPASANRIMAVFRGVVRACVTWGWLTHAPPVAMATVEGRPASGLDGEQCARLYAELPAHLKGPMMFAVLTGLREGNVCKLTWSQVDLERGRVTIPSSHYKTKRDYAASLSTAAIEVLKAQPQTSDYVFTYKGEPVGRFNNHAFRKARKRAGLAHVRWHDLRHTFASWMAQGGASDRVLQQAGGWTSPKMVARYAHLRPDDLRPHVDAVGTILGTALSKAGSGEVEKDV
jgi:integrase